MLVHDCAGNLLFIQLPLYALIGAAQNVLQLISAIQKMSHSKNEKEVQKERVENHSQVVNLDVDATVLRNGPK